MAKPYWLTPRDGRWHFVWQPDPARKSYHRHFSLPREIKTEREAKRYAELHEDEIKGAKSRTRAHGGQTVSVLVERWATLREKDHRFSAATFGDAICHLHKWVCKPVGSVDLGAKLPEHLDAPLVRKWVRALSAANSRNGKPLAPYTIRNILRALKWFLSDVIGEGWATIPGGNPAKDESVQSELPAMEPLAGKSQRLKIATPEEAQRLLDCPRVRLQWRVRYALDMTSGLRAGEVAGLRVQDVDRVGSLVHVKRALQLKSRKGYAQPGKTKTRESERTLPLHPAALAALTEWLDEGWVVHVGRAPGPEDYVFVKRDGKPWRPRSAERFRVHARLAGLPSEVDGHPLTFHALRRSFVNWLRAEKVPAEVRQVLMGHVPRTAEERHYSEEDPRVLAEYVGKIRLVWRRVEEAPADRLEEPMPHKKQLHGRDRMRKMRRDFEG